MGTSTNNNSNYLHNQAQISKFGPFSVNDYFAKPLKSYTSSCARAQYDQMTTSNSTFTLQLLKQLQRHSETSNTNLNIFCNKLAMKLHLPINN